MLLKNSLFLIFVLTYTYLDVSGQELSVVDEANNTPISGLQIRAQDNKIIGITDHLGKIPLDTLTPSEAYIFYYSGYEVLRLKITELKKLNYIVKLQSFQVYLDQVVVSSTKWKTDKRSVPNTVDLITRENIVLHQPQTSADLLGLNGSVFIQKSQQGGGSPMVRGFSANRVLLTIDGVRMNNAIFRNGNIHNVISIDPNLINKTELIFGPGSLIYGSDAIGGVLNFFSKEPSLSENTSWQGTAAIRYSSANQENLVSTQLEYRSKKIAILSSFTFNRFGNLRMGSQNVREEYLRTEFIQPSAGRDSVITNENPLIQTPSGYTQYNTLHKIHYQINPNWNVQYAFHYTTTGEIPRYDRLIEYDANNQLMHAEWYYGPQTWSMHQIRVNHYKNTKWYNGLKINLARQHFGESRHNRRLGSSLRNNRFENVIAWSLNIDAEKKLSPDVRLFYGLEGVYNLVKSRAHGDNILTDERFGISTRYPDGSIWYSGAAYFNVFWKVSSNWNLQGGLRYNSVGAYGRFDDPFFLVPFKEIGLDDHAIIGSLGAFRNLSREWQLKLNVGNGFRAPNIDDISKVFDSEPGNVTVPNPDLKPEKAYNFETTIEYNSNKQWGFRASIFYTYLSDAMVRRPFQLDGQDSIFYEGSKSAVIAIVNAASAYVYGFESGLYYRPIKGLTAEIRYNFQKGKETLDDGSRGALRHAIPGFGRFSLQYKGSNWETQLYLLYQHTFLTDQLAPSEIAKPHLYAKDASGQPFSPSWWTINLSVGYALTSHFRINFMVENLLDFQYRPYSSGISAPGINLRLGATGTF